MRIMREKGVTKSIKKILNLLKDEDEDTKFQEDVEEVLRLGPYIEGVEPIKLRLNKQTATKEICARTHQLRDIEEYKNVFIKKNMNDKEKQKLKELKEQAKQKNYVRTTE